MAYFAASCDPVQKNTDFAKSLELDYPILSDPDGKVATAYGIYNGNFSGRATFIVGVDKKILEVIKKVNTTTHGADVATHLKKLGVEEK